MQKANRKEFRVGKVIKSQGDKLYIKRKCYDNLFNSWKYKIDIAQTSKYFPEPKSSGERVKEVCVQNNYRKE